jgi:hypothetical protein
MAARGVLASNDMPVWSEARRLLQILAIAALVYTAWVVAIRQYGDRKWRARHEATPAAEAEFSKVYGGDAVKILQFYSREGSLTEGEDSVLCYGVVNAKTLRIDPPVDGVFPALSRCVSVAPEHDTRYTLTAEGSDGRMVSESFVLEVRPDVSLLPKITSFGVIDRKRDYRGRMVFLLSFAVQNAELVEIDPPAFPTLHGAPNGRFYVAPAKTTTYTLTVTGKRGHTAHKQLTLEVPAG